jgi:PiT family inorganic phosphate transporter
VALAHGTSDGQKTMGVITLVLIAAGFQTAGTGPQWWVILIAGCAIGLGTYSGGWRIMRTMGKGLCDIESPQGFAAETSSTVAILASSHLGFALSTTQVCSGSILGSGLGRRTEVRWSTAGKMAVAWVITLPSAAIVGGLASLIAGIGIGGMLIDMALLLVGALLIVRQSRKSAVDSKNVNDSGEVNVRTRTAVTEGAAA